MGNIASSSLATPWAFATWGNKRVVRIVVTGDGSNTIVPVPIRPLHAWIVWDQGANTDTVLYAANPYFTVNNSSQPYTVTYSSTPQSNKKHTLFILGDD